MLTIIAYTSGILGIIASVIEILQFLKILTPKYKLMWFFAVLVATFLCFSIYYVIDNRNEKKRIESIRNEFLKKDAKSVVDAIIINGWEKSGDYLGYLSQITGFYQRHKDIYEVEYNTYQLQLNSWSKFFEKSREANKFYQAYDSELSELKGMVTAGRDNIEIISEQK